MQYVLEYRQTDRQKDPHGDGQAYLQAVFYRRHVDGQLDRNTYRQTDRKTYLLAVIY